MTITNEDHRDMPCLKEYTDIQEIIMMLPIANNEYLDDLFKIEEALVELSVRRRLYTVQNAYYKTNSPRKKKEFGKEIEELEERLK
jgi:hypothetical protein